MVEGFFWLTEAMMLSQATVAGEQDDEHGLELEETGTMQCLYHVS